MFWHLPNGVKFGWVSDSCNSTVVVGERAPLPSVKPRRLAAFVRRDAGREGGKCPLLVRSC